MILKNLENLEHLPGFPSRKGQRGQFFTCREMMGTELEGCEGKLWTQHLGECGHELRFRGLLHLGVLGPGEPNSCQTLSWAPPLCSASKPHQSSHQGVLDIGWCLSSTWRLKMLRCEQVFAFFYWVGIPRWWAWCKYLEREMLSMIICIDLKC